jgi:hypothetical protein
MAAPTHQAGRDFPHASSRRITVVGEAAHLMMLFDAGDAWLAWNGKLVHRVLVGLA